MPRYRHCDDEIPDDYTRLDLILQGVASVLESGHFLAPARHMTLLNRARLGPVSRPGVRGRTSRSDGNEKPLENKE